MKLTLGLYVAGVIRTVTPGHIRSAFDFTHRVLPHISYNQDILTIQPEASAAHYKHHDNDIAMHCSCILRNAIEYKTNPDSNDIFIVAGALIEKIQRPDTDETLMTHIWKLDTEEKRAQFLDRHIELYLQAFVPICRDYGMALSAHGQNTLVRFDRITGELKGFVFRDIDGVIAHSETVKDTCGIDYTPHAIEYSGSLEDVYRFIYLTSFETYLNPMIHARRMYQNARGWQMVRTHLSKLIPLSHSMSRYLFEQKEIPSICFVRCYVEKDIVYRPKPNLLYGNPLSE